MRDFLERLVLAVAPIIAQEVTRAMLERRPKPATIQPSDPAPSFAAYVSRHR